MKDLSELDEESIKFKEKMWNKELNNRKNENKIKKDEYPNKNRDFTGFNTNIPICEKLKAIDFTKKYNIFLLKK